MYDADVAFENFTGTELRKETKQDGNERKKYSLNFIDDEKKRDECTYRPGKFEKFERDRTEWMKRENRER